jgi:hypothetical protein
LQVVVPLVVQQVVDYPTLVLVVLLVVLFVLD